MAFSAGYTADIYVNGFDLTTYLNAAGLTINGEVFDATTFRDQWMKYVAGRTSGTLNIAGFASGDDDEIDDILDAALAVKPSIWSLNLSGGDVFSGFGYGIEAIETQYTLTMPTAGIVTISAQAQSNSPKEMFIIHKALAAVVAPANGTAVDNGASSANGGSGWLQVMDFDGTDATVKITDSADDMTYGDLITFTEITGPNVAERLTDAGTIERYTRYEVDGTFNSITLQVGFYRNP